jgi:DNA gyrase subunit A
MQKRGGKGVIGAETRAEDFIWDIFVANTHNYILCFTDQGKVYWLKVYKIPEIGRAAKGKPVVNLLNLSTKERVQAVLPVREFKDTLYVLMSTLKGVVKKISLDEFSRPNRKGIIALSIDEGDSLVDAKIAHGSDNVLLVSKYGQAIQFPESDVRSMGRTARGVCGMSLDANDEVVGMEILSSSDKGFQILTVTEKGYGKRTSVDEYKTQCRGGSGVLTMRVTEKNGPVVAVRKVKENNEIIVASNHGKVIRTRVAEISEVGRVAQGVRLITLDEGEFVGAIAKIEEENEGAI